MANAAEGLGTDSEYLNQKCAYSCAMQVCVYSWNPSADGGL